MNQQLKERLDFLSQSQHVQAITGIRRGIERESLRMDPNTGKVSQKKHPESLGSALTHGQITTDFSEALLEFITPAGESIDETLAQLRDIHKYVNHHIRDEFLWPISMPCFVQHEDEIPLAYYGHSNIGQMKRVYREGLKNRYGSMMQAISGVHFNLSFSQSMWQALAELEGKSNADQDYISQKYFDLIRNFKRHAWLIVYLFGASPAICKSFLQGQETALDFQARDEGSLYLEYGTSIRMGDLGYTNHAQGELNICYNKLVQYTSGLREAINTPSADYAQIGIAENGVYRQLNDNVLQIENEFYSPIRPKRTPKTNESPTQALERRGVEYIEVRALDVNPFEDIGISKQQVLFLDVFLAWCLWCDSPEMSREEYTEVDKNLAGIVSHGRHPELILQRQNKEILGKDWMNEIVSEMAAIAEVFDIAYDTKDYAMMIHEVAQMVEHPEQTLSGQLLTQMNSQDISNGNLGLALAKQYQSQLDQYDYQVYSEEFFIQSAQASKQEQQNMEDNEQQSFSDFLEDYFVTVNTR
ncbi:glutamate--cysteine ligase [Algicola sagamiensis]|uniref:glutamate--cysteine ligase n=1 Tax=Algicola sagamiensis TaxID=163869 RepID=UPI00035F1074|nr:glutamate--cysteine ligase [Algicola sagamiensis]